MAAQQGKVMATVLRVVVTAALFALIFRSIDTTEVWGTLKGISLWWLPVAVVLQMVSTFIGSYRWYRVMARLNFGGSFQFYLHSYFKGMFFNQSLPTSIGGDVVRVLDVAGRGHRKRDAFLGVVIDRGLGLAGLLLLNLLANLWRPDLLPAQVFLALTVIVGVGLLGFVLLLGLRRFHFFERWHGLRQLRLLSVSLAKVLHGVPAVALQTGLALAVHISATCAVFVLGRAVGLDYGLSTFFVILPPVLLLTLVPISLAGWGVREGGMVGLFTLIGADQAAVLSMSILYGLVLIVASLPGLWVYLRGRQRVE